MCFLCARPNDPVARLDPHLSTDDTIGLSPDGWLAPIDVMGSSGTGESMGGGAFSAPFTLDQIANYLTGGFWAFRGEAGRAFDVGPDRTLTVDISNLSANAQTVARAGLDIWSDVTGITFAEVVAPTLTVVSERADFAAGITTNQTITNNSDVRGSLTVGDSDAVRIALTAGVTYTIAMNTVGPSGLDPYLRVLDSRGNQIAFNDDGGGFLNSALSFTPLTTGTYYLVAGSYQNGSAGSYSMTVSSTSAEITFGSGDTSGAYATSVTSGNTIISSFINIADTWDTMTMNGYMLQTYVHEIGHALGLGHAGPYNGRATWGVDNLYDNDSWLATVMSYFDVTQNTFVPGDRAYLGSVMPADIIAIQNLYGFTGSTHGGNTVWGPGGNLGNTLQIMLNMWAGLQTADPLYYRNQPIAFMVYDTGGIDTLDFSSFAVDQEILLTALQYSNIGGLIDNVVIARGVVIENAIGGAGNDSIVGNSVGNNLIGNAGNDTLLGGEGADWLTPGRGNDRVDGGAGNDMVSFFDATARVVVNLISGTAIIGAETNTLISIENVTGTIYGDLIIGDAGANRIRALGDYDWMVGSGGGDSFDGGTGRDTVAYSSASSGVVANLMTDRGTAGQANGDIYDGVENLTGSSHGDRLTGDLDRNILRGLGGDDFIFGMSGRDTIDGGAGRDMIYGGDDNDRVTGGSGNDSIDGGSGWDTAIFSGARSQYVISTAGGITAVRHTVAGGDGMDYLTHVEVMQFSDGPIFV